MTRRGAKKSSRQVKLPGKLETVPAWMQGIAAVAGVVISALAVFGLVGGVDPSASPSPSSTAPSSRNQEASVTLDRVATTAAEIRGEGSFSGLNPASDAVLFIGQPAPASGDWLPVVASLSGTAISPNGLESGRWHAATPGNLQGDYTWYAVIGPRVSGSGDPYEDLRLNGPLSELVKAASEPFSTGN